MRGSKTCSFCPMTLPETIIYSNLILIEQIALFYRMKTPSKQLSVAKQDTTNKNCSINSSCLANTHF